MRNLGSLSEIVQAMTSVLPKAMNGICRFHRIEEDLRESHTIPSFVFKWVKDTSATGYLRMLGNPNKRMQDGHKDYLLCDQTEQLFSEYERKFKHEVFAPWTKLLSETGATDQKFSFHYDEWLLRFIISVQWRAMILLEENNELEILSPTHRKLLSESKDQLLKYLRKDVSSTGPNSSYLILFMGTAGAEGNFSALGDKLNLYLLRAIDITPTFNRKELAFFTKLGPIGLITSLRPEKLSNMSQARIGKSGVYQTSQAIGPTKILDFIYKTRPTQMSNRFQISDKQQNKIETDMRKDMNRALTSLSFRAALDDEAIKGE